MFLWAVTGSNRRPLRCKCGPAESRYQQESAFPLLSSVFQGVVIVPSIAYFCARPRTIRGLEMEAEIPAIDAQMYVPRGEVLANPRTTRTMNDCSSSGATD